MMRQMHNNNNKEYVYLLSKNLNNTEKESLFTQETSYCVIK